MSASNTNHSSILKKLGDMKIMIRRYRNRMTIDAVEAAEKRYADGIISIQKSLEAGGRAGR